MKILIKFGGEGEGGAQNFYFFLQKVEIILEFQRFSDLFDSIRARV